MTPEPWQARASPSQPNRVRRALERLLHSTMKTTHRQPSRAPITHDGRTCGYFDPATGVHTRRWTRTHLVKRYNAIAYSSAVLDELERRGCAWLENTDPETGAVYRTEFTLIRQHGIPFDLGWGPQVALPLRHWGRADQAGPSAPAETQPAMAQLQLW